MKKLIILFLILGILLLGCKSYTQSSNNLPSSQNSPAIGGGCQVIENEDKETKVKYVNVQAGL